MMAGANLAALFHQIERKEHRISSLKQLLQTLSSQELDAVQHMIAERNDRLWTLPVELVLETFSYLPFFDIWRLQLVSRRWRSQLSSSAFLRASLARWETHNPADSARSMSLLATESAENKVQRIQAMRLARPLTTASFEHRRPRRWDMLSYTTLYQLQGARLAWVHRDPETRDRVVVRNLCSGKVMNFQSDARESIHHMTLTDQVMAFTTYAGTLHICCLSDAEKDLPPTRLRLPSVNVVDLTACQDTVALLFKTSSSSLGRVLIYGKDRILRDHQFPCEWDPESTFEPQKIMVDPDKSVIHIFSYRDSRCGTGLQMELGIRHTSFSLAHGSALRTLSEDVIHVEWHTQSTRINTLHSIGQRNKVLLELGYELNALPYHLPGLGRRRCVVFNLDESRFEAATFPPQEIGQCRVWKDMLFEKGRRFPAFYVHSMLSHNSEAVSDEVIRLKTAHFDATPLAAPFGPAWAHISVNDTFLVLVQERESWREPNKSEAEEICASFRVYCFDQQVPLAG